MAILKDDGYTLYEEGGVKVFRIRCGGFGNLYPEVFSR